MKILVVIAIVIVPAICLGQIPKTISYQGMIVNQATGESVPNGPHSVRFAFYDAPVDGNLKWQTSTIQVNTYKGLFAAIIPVADNAIWDVQFYVELIVDGTFFSRTPLTTVPYAFKTQTSDHAVTMDAAGLTGTIHDQMLSNHLQDLADGSLSGEKISAGINASNITTGIFAGNLVGSGIEASNIAPSSDGLIPNEVLDEDLRDLSDGSLSASKIGSGIDAAKITTGLLPDNVLSEHLQDLADGALSGAKIGGGINAGLISGGTLPSSVFNEHLQDLADGSLSGAKIGTGINASSITSGMLPDNVLNVNLQDLADGSLSGSKVGSSINAANVDTGMLPLSVLPANTVTGSGTDGRLVRWSGTSTLGTDVIYWDPIDKELGIGIGGNPSASLHILHDSGHPTGTGVLIRNNSTATSKTGIDISMTDNATNSDVNAIDVFIASSGTSTRRGISAIVNSNASNTSEIKAIEATASGQGSGTHYGIYGTAESSGAGSRIGVYGSGQGSGTGTKYGVHGVAGGNGTTKYGVRGESAGTGTSHYGVYGIASGATNNYGVYGSAPVALTNYAVYADGDIYATGIINNTSGVFGASDRKLKRNISPLKPMMSKILELKPSTYNFRVDEFPTIHFREGLHYGLIAQDVEKIFPELVSETVNPGPIDKEGNALGEAINYKSLDYISLIPILIKGIQEQQEMINEHQKAIDQLAVEVKELKSAEKKNSKNHFAKAN